MSIQPELLEFGLFLFDQMLFSKISMHSIIAEIPEKIALFQDFGMLEMALSFGAQLVADINPRSVPEFNYVLTKYSNLNYGLFVDLAVYDRPQYLKRFVCSYIYRDPLSAKVFKIRTATDLFTPIVSISTTHFSALSAEREATDMLGLHFHGHRELRRIIGDYSFWGFPLRRDFPMGGYFEYFFSLLEARVLRVRGNINNFWGINFQTWKSFVEQTPQTLSSYIDITPTLVKGLGASELFKFQFDVQELVASGGAQRVYR